MQYLTSEVRRLVTRKKQSGVGYLVWNTFATHWNVRKELRQPLFGNEINHFGHMCIDIARANRVPLTPDVANSLESFLVSIHTADLEHTYGIGPASGCFAAIEAIVTMEPLPASTMCAPQA